MRGKKFLFNPTKDVQKHCKTKDELEDLFTRLISYETTIYNSLCKKKFWEYVSRYCINKLVGYFRLLNYININIFMFQDLLGDKCLHTNYSVSLNYLAILSLLNYSDAFHHSQTFKLYLTIFYGQHLGRCLMCNTHVCSTHASINLC